MDAPSITLLRELVSHAWFTIGYPPSRSIVLVELDDTGAPGVVARVDQPPPGPPARPGLPPSPAPPAHRRAVATPLAQFCRHAGVRRAVVLLVQDASGAAGPGSPGFGPPEAALVRTLRQALRAAGVHVAELALVGSGRLRALDCPDPTCCPPGGAPLGDLMATESAARMVLRGRFLAGGESDLVSDVRPEPWPGAVLLAEPPAAPATRGLARWRAQHGALLAQGARRHEPAPQEVAWLVPALGDARLRDAVLVSVLPVPPGTTGDLAADLAAGHDEQLPRMQALAASPPDPDVVDAGRALLAAVARGAPAGRRAEALGALAWIAWWQGSGVRGRLLTGLALDDDPTHRLATIVDRLLLHGVPPSWAARPPAPAGSTVRGRG